MYLPINRRVFGSMCFFEACVFLKLITCYFYQNDYFAHGLHSINQNDCFVHGLHLINQNDCFAPGLHSTFIPKKVYLKLITCYFY